MKLDNLPFMHFMVRVGAGKQCSLLSPLETEEDYFCGGQFVVPMRGPRHFFPAYQFHFSFFVGNGQFLKTSDRKQLFTGLALLVREERKESLLLTFPFPLLDADFRFGPPWLYGMGVPLSQKKGVIVPIFERIKRQGLFPYKGMLKHPDFSFLFAEVESTNPKVLDWLLESYGISVIGCDPHTNYEKFGRE